MSYVKRFRSDYWNIRLFLYKKRIHHRLKWNEAMCQKRHAKLLYAMNVYLKKNPIDEDDSFFALMSFPEEEWLSIHKICMRAVYPDIFDWESNLFYLLYCNNGVFEEWKQDTLRLKQNRAARYHNLSGEPQDIWETQKSQCSQWKNVNRIWDRIPWRWKDLTEEVRRKRHIRQMVKQAATIEEIMDPAKRRHPEIPAEQWIPLDEAIARNREKKEKGVFFRLRRLWK